ncbi:hypothetical protein EHS17_15625 [Rhodobacteraceae bacterium CH30]|nr:hypothetical protein EHS17_15625 [Rhodobacteraceae bacterium CH30]
MIALQGARLANSLRADQVQTIDRLMLSASNLSGRMTLVKAGLTSVQANTEPVTYNTYAPSYFAQIYTRD